MTHHSSKLILKGQLCVGDNFIPCAHVHMHVPVQLLYIYKTCIFFISTNHITSARTGCVYCLLMNVTVPDMSFNIPVLCVLIL